VKKSGELQNKVITMDIPIYTKEVPYLTTAQMIEVDRAMIEDYKIELLQMMENAGRNLAHLARERFLGGDPRGKKVAVLAGTGGNGGGALVCARRLYNYGAQVQVFVTRPDADFTPIPAHQLDILHRMKVSVARAQAIDQAGLPDLIIDGLIGYSLKGAPRDTAVSLIRWANRQDAPILALDAPSGVDTTTGAVYAPAIKATATMTLALPKAGLRAPGVEAQVGELYLADIGVPPVLYAAPALGLQVGHIFAENDIVRLR
jgi:NAD(P)H-hydrate epimerase